MSRKTVIVVLVLLVCAALGAGAWYFTQSGPSSVSADADAAGFSILPSDRTLGNPKAKVTVIEYAAPSCPVCARFNELTFGAMKANYIDTGKIFYVFRVFPISADDAPAEKIARCLPEDKYFQFIDLLFRNQPKWDHEYGVTDVHAGLVLMGRIAGMSAADVDKCIDNKAEDDRINQVAADGQAKYSITGTPTFIVDGVAQPSGAIPYPEMQKILDAALAKH